MTFFDEQDQPHYFEIIKFHFKNENEYGVAFFDTLDEAQAYCNREDTRGNGWFCGYTRREGEKPDNA